MTQYLIPTPARHRHGMGRGLVNHDPRSWNYPAVDMLWAAERAQGLRARKWRRGAAYDQGTDPHCVAFTGKGVLNSMFMSRGIPWGRRSRYDTRQFYDGAQEHDEWPGDAYDGTSALGLCRYLTSKGIIGEYRWCFGLDDTLLTLAHIGPVMLGVWWYERMFTPDSDGFIDPGASGRAGGHEVEITGITPTTRTRPGFVTITNSWGLGWGVNGKCRMTFGVLERLLSEDGDAAVVVS